MSISGSSELTKSILEKLYARRNQADLKAAVEITSAFRRFSPEDPVKYDFALTRLGILKFEKNRATNSAGLR